MDFGNYKNSDLENELFEIAKSPIKNIDYKNIFLAYSFDNILIKSYSNRFNTKTFGEICSNIDSTISQYLDNKNRCSYGYEYKHEINKEFRNIFFKLNDIMIKNPSLKGYFSRFRYKKGEIALKFLINDDEGTDKFVEDVAKKFSNA